MSPRTALVLSLALLALPSGGCLRWPGEPASLSLSSGPSKAQWKPIEFINSGPVEWREDTLVLGSGEHLAGVVWSGPLPARENYEFEAEARRTAGFDFFCALTFPVGETSVTFVPGGWSGGVTGLSSVDGQDASKNATKSFVPFDDNIWYRLKVRVTPGAVEGFVNDKPVFRQERAGHTLGMRHGDIGKTAPLGLSTYNSAGEIRNLRWRKL